MNYCNETHTCPTETCGVKHGCAREPAHSGVHRDILGQEWHDQLCSEFLPYAWRGEQLTCQRPKDHLGDHVRVFNEEGNMHASFKWPQKPAFTVHWTSKEGNTFTYRASNAEEVADKVDLFLHRDNECTEFRIER